MDLATFDPAWIFLSMIPAGIGFVLFVYGKKQQRWPHLVAGLAMMAYPYFTSTLIAMTVVGAFICVALWYLVRLGY
jgi:mannose/fructose/N-acetylgalactosamine-specific phosphotransferase system component IIC